MTRLLARFEGVSGSGSPALVDAAGSTTFMETTARARQLARALCAVGLGGARIALLAPPDRSWVEAFWAIALAGGCAVPLSPLHPRPEQEALLHQSGARALLLAESLSTTASVEHSRRLVFGGGRLLGAAAKCEVLEHAASRPEPAEESSPVLLLYTSGTTGRPKGVPLSHHNVWVGVQALADAWQMTPRDRLLHSLPLHHLHGICVSLLCAFCAGATTRFLPRYDPARVLEHAAHASVLMSVPTQHKRLVDHLDAMREGTERTRLTEQLRELRLITSGSAKLPENLGRRLQELSGQYPLERYGMTEVGIVLSNPLHGGRVPGSCGAPLPGCDVRIVNEVGHDVAPGEPGEIWIRAGSVFSGYDSDAAATAAAFEAGFFKSGDTAVWTSEGFVRILGRTSVDIIKSGGYKLSAIELEEHLRSHPWVLDVAVVGVPDDTWGERAVAVIVPTPTGLEVSGHDRALAEREIQRWMKERVAGYQVPKAIVWRAALPQNAMGKVQKHELLAELGSTELGSTELLALTARASRG